ncbi:MAG: CoA pyrophosphatase [Desulfobacterales bacterium]|nr:CoA pyrophosphatase [Desulfobacterales bacterium]
MKVRPRGLGHPMTTGLCGNSFIDGLRGILGKRERRVMNDPAYARAAVIVPLFNKDGSCHILFTKRTHLVKHHKGQISFPGGVFDEEDGDLGRTALREAFEEIGLKEDDVQIIGVLDDIVTVTGFIVTPFVGVFGYPYHFRLSQREIEELIEVPLSSLLNPACFSASEIVDGDRKRLVYNYQCGPHSIWGATALILKQFLGLISASGRA